MTFDEYVSARLGALVRYATVVTCDVHLAEDITQNVLVRARGRWSRIGRLDVPEQYLKRMVLNEFLSWRRRRAAAVVPLSLTDLERVAPPAIDPTDAHDERDAVLRLVAALPPRQRAAVALRYYEDLSDDQIADLLGCRPATVRSHISRALAALREHLPHPTTAAVGSTPFAASASGASPVGASPIGANPIAANPLSGNHFSGNHVSGNSPGGES